MNNQDFMKLQTCVLRVNFNCACDGCKQKVKKLLNKLDGVYSTSIDVEQGKVTVTGNADPATMIKKLVKSGKHAEMWGVATTGKKQQLKNNNNGSFDSGNDKGGSGGGKGMKDNHHQAQIQQKIAKGFKDLNKDTSNKDKKQDQKSVKFNLPVVDDDFDDDDSCFDDEDEFDDDDDDCFDDFDQNQQHYPSSTKMMPPPMGLGVPHAHVKADGKNTKKWGGGVGGFELPSLQQFKGMTLGKGGKSKTTTNSDDSSNKKSSNAKGAVKKDDGKGKTKGDDGKSKTKGDDGKSKTKGDDGKSKTKGDDGKKGGGLNLFGGKKSGIGGGFLGGVVGKTGGGKKNGDSKSADNGEKMNLDASKKGGGQGQTQGQTNSKQNGASGNMGQMGMGGYPMTGNYLPPMGQMRAAQGLPTQVNPGYFTGQGQGQGYNPYNNQLQQQLLQQQQQYMAAMMMNQQQQQQQQQQQLLQQRGYPPMMYGQPQGPMTYGPPMPPPQDNFSHIFSDENTDSCNIM